MANNLPEPETRKEIFLASAAGQSVSKPDPVTREEMFLDAIAKGGGVSPDDAYTKAQTDALLASKVDKVTGKGLSTNDFTNADKTKLDSVEFGAKANVQADWAQMDTTADDYVKNKPTIPTVNDATLTIQKNGTAVGTFSANAATGATVNITVPVDAEDVDALPDTTKYGASLALSVDSSTYIVTATLKDQDGNTLGTAQTIDLPLETVVVGGSYDDATKKVILTLKNGNTIDFSVADLVAGLQTEITSTNKIDADLVDDTNSVHKFVTAADKSAWNAKSDFSGSYNDLTNKPTIPTVDQTYESTSANAQSGEAVAQAISTKVDKETGKGLSTNDYTDAEKTKLNSALTPTSSLDPSNLSATVPVDKGGTGATSASSARSNLGLGDAATYSATSSVTSGSSSLVTSGAVYSTLFPRTATMSAASGITISYQDNTFISNVFIFNITVKSSSDIPSGSPVPLLSLNLGVLSNTNGRAITCIASNIPQRAWYNGADGKIYMESTNLVTANSSILLSGVVVI